MGIAIVTGILAGIAMGYVLQRGQLCFNAMFADAWQGRSQLLRALALAVVLGAVGLAVLYVSPLGSELNTGLPFRPVANVIGGLLIGWGMAIAQSCVSGLLYKFGAGMAGAALGILGWIGGELAVRQVRMPGPTVLPGGDGGTIPGLLGLPRLLVALVVLAIVGGLLWRWRSPVAAPRHRWQWNWPTLGVALGVVLVLGWVLAAIGGVDFGPSTVGASAGAAAGNPNWWLIAFLLGIVGWRWAGGTPDRCVPAPGGGEDLVRTAARRWLPARRRWLDRRRLQRRPRAVRHGAAERLLDRGCRPHGPRRRSCPSDDPAAEPRPSRPARLIDRSSSALDVGERRLTPGISERIGAGVMPRTWRIVSGTA